MKIHLLALLLASFSAVGCIGSLPMPSEMGGHGGTAAAAGSSATGGTAGARTGQAAALISPDSNGIIRPNPAGVVGAWWSTGDYYASPDLGNVPGGGDCPRAGFGMSQCSDILSPDPLAPTFAPDPNGGMCTSGVAAVVPPDSTGQPAWSAVWGNMIGFTLNTPAVDANGNAPHAATGQWDAVARGFAGFAFDLDGNVNWLRVEFQTQGTEKNAAYWGGAGMDLSPVAGPRHYEIRWADVGGPAYLAAPPAFDPTKLEAIQFHVPSSNVELRSYSYCIRNTALLAN